MEWPWCSGSLPNWCKLLVCTSKNREHNCSGRKEILDPISFTMEGKRSSFSSKKVDQQVSSETSMWLSNILDVGIDKRSCQPQTESHFVLWQGKNLLTVFTVKKRFLTTSIAQKLKTSNTAARGRFTVCIVCFCVSPLCSSHSLSSPHPSVRDTGMWKWTFLVTPSDKTIAQSDSGDRTCVFLRVCVCVCVCLCLCWRGVEVGRGRARGLAPDQLDKCKTKPAPYVTLR